MSSLTENLTAEKEEAATKFDNNERFKKLYANNVDGYARMDLLGRILECNKSFASMLGYTIEEMQALTYFEVTPPKWISLENKIVHEQILKRGFSEVYEKEYFKKDGTKVPVEIVAHAMKDDKGSTVGIWSIVRDITDRKLKEESTNKDFKQIYQLFENCYDGVLIADNETKKFIYANPGVCKLLKYTKEELQSMSVKDIHPKEELESALKDFELMTKEKKSHCIHQALCKDGSTIYVEISSMLTKVNNRTYGMGIFRDISDTMKIYDELEKRNSEVYEKTVTLKHVLSQIEFEKNKIKENIALNIEKNISPIIKCMKEKREYNEAALSAIEDYLVNLTSDSYRKLVKVKYNLSPAEVKVCQLVQRGYIEKEISGVLGISISTVKKHKKSIRRKFGISKTGENLRNYLENIL